MSVIAEIENVKFLQNADDAAEFLIQNYLLKTVNTQDMWLNELLFVTRLFHIVASVD